MRFLLALCFCFCVANSSALGQLTDPSRSASPAPQTPARPRATLETVPVENFPLQTAPQQTVPQPDPGASINLDELTPVAPDDLDLDSSQSFDFDDSDDYQYASTSDFQSSIASNSNFRGASPQMIGDFGGGSTILTINTSSGLNGGSLSVPIPLAGGSRRIKIAENNQVTPLDRVYGTFNYFHNSSQAIDAADGSVALVESESLIQYTLGFEKTFIDDLFSIDVRMPFTGGVDQRITAPGAFIDLETGEVGNLSATLKALLLKTGQTSISGGLGISIPTGSGVDIRGEDSQLGPFQIEIDNDAVHLMPFVGVYRPFGDSWWLQAFTQVDTPTNGNDVDNGLVGRLTEQTLLYADISLGKWWYRSRCNQSVGCDGCDGCGGRNGRRRGGCGVTGVASILELHYTTSLNDADGLLNDLIAPGQPGIENRFDVLNLTAGLQVDISERWRINFAGAFPLREGRFKDGGRREDRFFDSEFSLQVNRFF